MSAVVAFWGPVAAFTACWMLLTDLRGRRARRTGDSISLWHVASRLRHVADELREYGVHPEQAKYLEGVADDLERRAREPWWFRQDVGR